MPAPSARRELGVARERRGRACPPVLAAATAGEGRDLLPAPHNGDGVGLTSSHGDQTRPGVLRVWPPEVPHPAYPRTLKWKSPAFF